MSGADASALVEELLAGRRISSVEAEVLRLGLIQRSTPSDWMVPSDFGSDGLRIWLRMACSRLGIRPTKLASMACISGSMIDRFLDEDAVAAWRPETLSALTIERLIRAVSLCKASSP